MINISKIFMFKEQATHDELLVLFKDHYEKEKDFVRSSIYWMVNSSEVDDLVQDCFVKAWKSFNKFESNSTFRTWIYRIAMNVTYDYLKKNSAKAMQVEDYQLESQNTDYELVDLISKGLMLLSIEQREAFSLHYHSGLTYGEAAILIGVPVGTVKSRANSAKAIFVKFLNDNGVTNE